MYRLLVVDDEPEVAEGLMDILEGLKGDDLELLSAFSASETLLTLERIRVDIVLTDIHMPEMNGLAMYQEIKKRWPRCRVIFISGVRDFDYVYQSIQNRDVRYLTKMEPDQKIRDTVQEVIRELEQKNLLNDALEQARQYYVRAIPLLREQYLSSLLEGSCPLGDINQDTFDELNIFLKAGSPALLFGLYPDRPPREPQEEEGQGGPPRSREEKLLLYSLQAVCQDSIRDYTSRFCCFVDHSFLIWILQLPQRKGTPHTRAIRDTIFEEIQKSCRQNLKRTVSIAYQPAPVLLQDLSAAYFSVRQTLGYGRYRFSEGIWEAGRQPAPPAEGQKNASELMKSFPALESALDLGDKDGFYAAFGSVTAGLSRLPLSQKEPAAEIYFRIAALLLKYINLWDLREQIEKDIPLQELFQPEAHGSWEKAVYYLETLSQRVIELHSQNERERFLDAVPTVEDYIRKHLHADLSLTALSAVAHLHPSYLSRLFKEATGQNLNRYILDLRMHLAQKLLRNSHDKIQTIAQKTGYVTTQTFNRAFKKYTGATPNEYRGQNQSRE